MIKRIASSALKIIISAGLISYLFYKLGYVNVFQQLLSIKIGWLLAAIFIFTLSNIVASYQWFLLLRLKNIQLPFQNILSFYYVGLFFNNFLVGYIGGDAFRIYDVSKAGGNNSHAVSAVFFDRLIGFTILTFMALATTLYWSNVVASQKFLFAIGVIFLGWVALFIMLFNEKLIKSMSWIFKKSLPPKINTKVKEIYFGINTFKHHKKELGIIILISIITQSLRILVHFYAARAVGVSINLMYFIIFIPIIALLSSLPISIGGIGIRESSGVALFSSVWQVHADIVAFEFLAFLIGIVSTVPGGVVFMFRRGTQNLNNKGDNLK